MTIGDLVAFQGYLLLLALPLGFLGFATAITAQAIASGERIFAVIDVPLEVEEKPGAIAIERPRGELRYENVSFGYGRQRTDRQPPGHRRPGRQHPRDYRAQRLGQEHYRQPHPSLLRPPPPAALPWTATTCAT